MQVNEAWRFPPSNVRLKEFLEPLGDDEIIYVGAIGAWMFIGTKAEYERDKDEVYTYYSAGIINRMRELNLSIDGSIKNKTKKQYKKALETLYERYELCIPLDDRRICNTYRKTLHQKGWGIIVEGGELAEAWNINEYRALKTKFRGAVKESMANQTHCKQIIEYLHTHKGITQLEATRAFGCTRLPARIWDLKQMGYEFRKVSEKSPVSAHVKYDRYYIKKEPEENKWLEKTQ